MLIAGLVTLLVAAEFLVRGAAWLALALGLRPLTVGLTVVAFGTSAPELVVTLTAAFEGQTELALGTVFGSNLANILLVIGISALVKPILTNPTHGLEIGFFVLVALLPTVPLCFGMNLDAPWGAVFLALLVAFLFGILGRERRTRGDNAAALDLDGVPKEAPVVNAKSVLVHVGILLVGCAGLHFGSQWLVSGASAIALDFGMSETLVGMSVVAVGTSLPELATSALAAKRGHPELALGNVLGSNVFNVGMVLGITSVVAPLPVSMAEHGLLIFGGLGATLALVACLTIKRGVPRVIGLLFLLSYAALVFLQAR